VNGLLADTVSNMKGFSWLRQYATGS